MNKAAVIGELKGKPKFRYVESLNAAVAGSICMFAIRN
jgi:hypothetical protein